MKNKKVYPRVAVIGGGIGGLTAALELCAHGCEVSLFETQNTVGGKIQKACIARQTIDTGPTVLTMRWVFEQVFRDVGSLLEDHVHLVRSDRIARHAWDDGSILDLFSDTEKSRSAIEAFAGVTEADGFTAFSKYARNIYDHAYPTFMTSPDPSISYMARHAGPKAATSVFHLDPFRKMPRAIRSFFKDTRLRQLFLRYATYYGSSPFMAPATLNLISHVEQQGVWLPADGMTSLAHAVARLAEEKGATIHCNTRVREIRVKGGTVQGVELEDDTFYSADAVVYNGDVTVLGNGGMGQALKGVVSPTKPNDRSLAALVGAMVAQTDGFPLAPHNVFFHTTPYETEFSDIFKKGRLPSHPTVYVRAQDRDPGSSLTQNGERLFFIINAPPRGDLKPLTEEEIETCVEKATTLFNRVGMTITLNPSNKQLLSPNHFAKQFPGTGGALYGPATHSMWASVNRSGVRAKMRGLYLAGGSVHPGAGVPMAALGGRQAATSLLSDFGLTGPCPLTDIPGGISTA